jgi:hypothetical protein
MQISAVLILPAALRDAGNQLAIALGHDVPPGDTYNVPLYPIDGDEPTHWGTHTFATAKFVTDVTAAQQGQYPDGINPEAAGVVVAALLASFAPLDEVSPGEHFDSVAAANGLERRAAHLPE